jgi:serine/threonine-protein phosphatase 2A activator
MEPPSSTPTAPSFPALEVLDPSTPHSFLKPAKRINDGPDVTHFLRSQAYRDIGTFVLQLNRAMCPRRTAAADGKPGSAQIWTRVDVVPGSTVDQLRQLLARVEAFVEAFREREFSDVVQDSGGEGTGTLGGVPGG